MSGIEVVGLVLGVIPLAISALEHYKEGIDVISDFRNYRSMLKSLKTKLSIQEELFRGTLQRLLLSELSAFEVRALFPEPGENGNRALWGTEGIKDKLQKKLGSKFGIFMDVVVDMNTIMERLMEKLDIDIDGQPKWNPRSSADVRFQDLFAWEWRRIRRSLGKAEREELISSFERYNNNLASFVHNNEILAPQTEGRGRGFVKYLELVRDQACGLHSVLGKSWRCTSSCKTSHKAYLRLNHPSEITPSPRKFDVTFQCRQTAMVGPELSSEPGKCLWSHTSISISEPESRVEPSVIAISSVVPSSPSESHTTTKLTSSSKSRKEKKPSRVRFSTATQINFKAPLVAPLSPPEVSTPVKAEAYLTAVSLCSALSAAAPVKHALSSLLNESAEQVALITTNSFQESSQPFCLDILLSKSMTSHRPRQKLSEKDRLKLALTLASAVLQLYESPWIESVWSGQHIEFLSSKSTDGYDASICGPFVSTSFNEPATDAGPEQLVSTNFSLVDSLIPSKVLFALALMLVELCLDKTLEEMRQVNPTEESRVKKPPSLLDDYEMAHEQLNAVYQKGGSNYGDVVQRCLKCEFNITPKEKRLNVEKFRLLVYEGVVAPLEDNYKKYLLYRGDV